MIVTLYFSKIFNTITLTLIGVTLLPSLWAQIEIKEIDSEYHLPENGPTHFRHALVADLDLDGNLDIVSSNGGFFFISWGRGDNQFLNRQHLNASYSESNITFGDFNRDGLPDLAAGTTINGIVVIFLNNGARRFTSFDFFMGPTSVSNLSAIDINNDGAVDLVAISRRFDRLDYATFQGTGPSFRVRARRTVSDSLIAPFSVVGGDFDQNGKIELLVSTAAGLYILEWQESENFIGGYFDEPYLLTSDYVDLDEKSDVRGITAQDFDQDGVLDIAIAVKEIGVDQETSVIWLKNEGNLSFSANFLERDSVSYFRWINATDLDGDGDPDLIASRWSSQAGQAGNLMFYLNDGRGNFSPYGIITNGTMHTFAILPQSDGRTGILPGTNLVNTPQAPLLVVPKTGFKNSSINIDYLRSEKTPQLYIRVDHIENVRTSHKWKLQTSTDFSTWSERSYYRGKEVFFPTKIRLGSAQLKGFSIPFPDARARFFRVVRLKDFR